MTHDIIKNCCYVAVIILHSFVHLSSFVPYNIVVKPLFALEGVITFVISFYICDIYKY